MRLVISLTTVKADYLYNQTSNGSWFDERDYFEFYPLHVLHKPKKNQRRTKIYTMEGVYKVNKDEGKVANIRPMIN